MSKRTKRGLSHQISRHGAALSKAKTGKQRDWIQGIIKQVEKELDEALESPHDIKLQKILDAEGFMCEFKKSFPGLKKKKEIERKISQLILISELGCYLA